jgi:hypothetical protein
MGLQEEIYGEDQAVIDDSVYFPTRFEYFAGLALSGLITGRSEKDIRKAVNNAIGLATEMEEALDSAEG